MKEESKPPLKVDSNIEILTPTKNPIVVKRKISYIEQDQAFTSIRLGKEYLNEFDFLKDKVSDYDYICLMKLHKEVGALKREIDFLTKQGVIPIIMTIGKEKKEDESR